MACWLRTTCADVRGCGAIRWNAGASWNWSSHADCRIAHAHHVRLVPRFCSARASVRAIRDVDAERADTVSKLSRFNAWIVANVAVAVHARSSWETPSQITESS